jgi:RimJ/RimL family protein N-acetyltransferase
LRPVQIETERMTLIPATLPMLRAELTRPEEFSRLLEAEVASPWPPPLNNEASNQWMIRQLEQNPETGGWGMWYYLLRRSGGQRPILIGNGGYKGAPTSDGTVEIGYSIVESYQRKGLGSEAARGLVDHAFRDPSVKRVIAETFPHLVPSIGVLMKNGFHLTGLGSEEGAIQFELKRKNR